MRSTHFNFQSLRPTYYLKDGQNVTEENPFGWVKVSADTPDAENHVGYVENVHALNLPIPLFSLLKFFFYFGWLHVSQVLINPLGDDDEDFDVNDLLDRHLQISYLMVEGEDNEDEPEDPHNGLIPRVLPNMDEARLQHRRRPSQPFPTDHLVVARPRKTSLADGSWTTPILANRWLQRTLEGRRQREHGSYDEIEAIKENETAEQETIPQRKKGDYGALRLTKES